jgi:hypothetical protein
MDAATAQRHPRSSLASNSFHRSLSSPDIQKSSDFSSSLPENVETRSSRKTPDGSVSFESFETHTNRLGTPQVQLNGSLLSISNSHLMESTNKFMDYTRKVSMSSQHSDSRRNLLFQNVGRTLQRTHSHLKRTRLLHAFYLFALPIYTLIGAILFQVKLVKYFSKILLTSSFRHLMVNTMIC